jgi:acyl-CoA synthetase (AMP-forming)/AMP-acid ligase II
MDNLAAAGGVPGPGRIGRVAIGDLLKRAARRFPDRIAVSDGARRVTFTEIERDANRFANYLVARGLKRGDKISTMIKSGGENVASVKIEETLLAHPAAQNAAVVGLPHPQWGEAVSAFVRLKPGVQASEAEIAEHCRKSLGGFQVPKLVRILDEMPMTAAGKLRKVELRQAYGDYFAAKSA